MTRARDTVLHDGNSQLVDLPTRLLLILPLSKRPGRRGHKLIHSPLSSSITSSNSTSQAPSYWLSTATTTSTVVPLSNTGLDTARGYPRLLPILNKTIIVFLRIPEVEPPPTQRHHRHRL